MVIRRKYIVDESNKPVGVQLDMKTFNHIEEVLENYALAHFIEEEEGDQLSLEDAIALYRQEGAHAGKL